MEEAGSPVSMMQCPYCAEPVNKSAKKCKHCGEVLDPQMREIELLKRQQNNPQVFMNAGGGAAAAGAGSGFGGILRPFPHGRHILLTLLTGGLWLPFWLLLYWFRNKIYYY